MSAEHLINYIQILAHFSTYQDEILYCVEAVQVERPETALERDFCHRI